MGREWLFRDIEEWFQDPSALRLFWISGQIGSGKTAVASMLVQTRPEIVAFHFASRVDEQLSSARRCILSLVYQLTTQLPEYSAVLQCVVKSSKYDLVLIPFFRYGDPLEELIPVSTVQILIDVLLIRPLNGISPPGRTMVSSSHGMSWFE